MFYVKWAQQTDACEFSGYNLLEIHFQSVITRIFNIKIVCTYGNKMLKLAFRYTVNRIKRKRVMF